MAFSRRKPLQFIRDLEMLETRQLLSGHGLTAGFAYFAPDLQEMRSAAASISQFASAHASSSSFSAQHTVLTATLTDSSGTATGSLFYSTSTYNGTTRTELRASIQGAAADTTLDVTVDGTVVGQITTDSNGAGKLELSSNPDGDDQSLPADFPTSLSAGAAVSVGTASGTLATPTFPGNGGGCSHGQGTQLSAALTDSSSSATGTVDYSTRTHDSTTTTKLTISVTGATASSTLDIVIDGTTIGQLTTDDTGAGKVVYSSNPGTGEQALPTNLPTTIAAGSTVSVGSLTGSFATSTSTATSHLFGGGFMRHMGRHR